MRAGGLVDGRATCRNEFSASKHRLAAFCSEFVLAALDQAKIAQLVALTFVSDQGCSGQSGCVLHWTNSLS